MRYGCVTKWPQGALWSRPHTKLQKETSLRKRQWLAAIATVLVVVRSTQSHFVWIERDGEGPARAYFGNGPTTYTKTGGARPHPVATSIFISPHSRRRPLSEGMII